MLGYQLKNVCVFCGACPGTNASYSLAADKMAAVFNARQVGLVYGGGKAGIMGRIADAVLSHRGRVIGIMPRFLLEQELGHRHLTELRIVEDMQERKIAMSIASDAFVALPGGIGTLDEISEMWTLTKLGVQNKPCGLLNIDNYYAPLVDFFHRMVEKEFLPEKYLDMLIVEEDPVRLMDRLEQYLHEHRDPEPIQMPPYNNGTYSSIHTCL